MDKTWRDAADLLHTQTWKEAMAQKQAKAPWRNRRYTASFIPQLCTRRRLSGQLHTLAALPPEKRIALTEYEGVGGVGRPERQSECFGNQKNISVLLGIEL